MRLFVSFSRLAALSAFLIMLGGTALSAQNSPESAPPAATPAPTSPQVGNASLDKPAKKSSRGYDPLVDPPRLPKSPITLVGGTLTEVDRVQDRLTVVPFAGKQKLRVEFDVRTHIFREGKPTSRRDLKTGERVYLDTMLDGSSVFAKTIWIRKSEGSGNGRGQIVSYDSTSNLLTLRDEVSAEPVDFRVDPSTVIRKGSTTGSIADLRPGSLVAVTFDPQQKRAGVVREVSLLAEPGSTFTFLGRVTFIDLSQKLIALNNQSDDKNYEIYFESVPPAVLRGLREGSQASISAIFDGNRYVAQKIDLLATGK